MSEEKVYRSETDKMRQWLVPYTAVGYGCCIGFGGDKIVSKAIGIDLPVPYACTGGDVVQLGGTAEDLYWFKDGVLDWVSSSHVLEDFEENKCHIVLEEWLRVLKPEGYLILNLPDEPLFYDHCVIQKKQVYNCAHKNHSLNIEWMRKMQQLINDRSGYEMVTEVLYTGVQHIYNFGLVWRKNKRSN